MTANRDAATVCITAAAECSSGSSRNWCRIVGGWCLVGCSDGFVEDLPVWSTIPGSALLRCSAMYGCAQIFLQSFHKIFCGSLANSTRAKLYVPTNRAPLFCHQLRRRYSEAAACAQRPVSQLWACWTRDTWSGEMISLRTVRKTHFAGPATVLGNGLRGLATW